MIAANKIRIHILIQCACLLSQYSGISWMHQVHFFVQPLVFFCTLDPSWAKKCSWLLIFAGGLDFLVLMSSGMVITRCLAGPYPACVQQSLDQLQVVTIAALHVFLDVVQILNLFIVKARNINQKTRMVIISWFLFLQDVSWVLFTQPTGIELGILAHPVYNILVCWVVASNDKNKFLVTIGIAVALLCLDSYLLLTRTGTIATGFLSMYVFTDILYVYFGYMVSLGL